MSYLIILALLLVLELLYFKVANKYNIIDKPNERSSHTRITLRGGGVVFYFGILLYFLFFDFSYPWFFIGLTLITVISFADDVRSVPNRIRLGTHIIAMLLLFYELGLFSGVPLWYILVALIFCTGIINAYNFMDGINGITGGYSLVVLLSLIYINRMEVTFIDHAFLYVAFLAVLVFNLFNFRTKAKCFAGDVGAVSIAFILVFAIGKLILLSGDFAYILLLAVYGVDSILTILHRLLLKENIFQPHRKHVYQLLANELKVKHVVVSGAYSILQLLIAVGLIYLNDRHLVYSIFIIGILSVVYVLIKWNFYKR
ncbi:MraY family glycosyltransferase [Massilibacteroides vaginae]|uniref:MraY family glycosyltransferase n=1 Tax=Massilibacteroides vaginae TaxID=1673718 RepID=UPI000A1CB598|nr:glycosyltransferase family 4 protein [Massilibacteroides vaginae]